MKQIRNFCIIAHVDHGKSTLADRFLELTGTIPKEKMRSQYLDQMPLERERGVTIKLAPVTMIWRMPNYQILNFKSEIRNELQVQSLKSQQDSEYILNLIDTPGHADFYYEVSRSLAAVEGAILLVDASQGVQAQTITNLRMALNQGLIIIPVLNKIDLPYLDLGARKKELAGLLNVKEDEILLVSAKTGQGAETVLESVIKKIPPPQGNPNGPLRALIFDSVYSEHKGVIAYLKIVDGEIKTHDKLEIMGTKTKIEAQEVGIFGPGLIKKDVLNTGSIGYLVTGLKDIKKCRVGDTIIKFESRCCEATPRSVNSKLETNLKFKIEPLPGYQEPKSMVFSGLYNQKSEEAEKLGRALEKLKLNDASLFFEPEKSATFGFGYRCGFLGLFHLEIIKERLKREYNIDVITTRPSVAYRAWLKNQKNFIEIRSPEKFHNDFERVEEPIMIVKIISPQQFFGGIVELIKKYRGEFLEQKYLTPESYLEKFNHLIIEAKIPLATLVVDFYDKLKNISAGFASMSYEFFGYQKADLVRLDILVAGQRQEPLSLIVYRDVAYYEGKKIVEFLKNNLPRQLFEVKIQAALGSRIIASEKLPALRKDVTAKLYGGDVTRKIKLLEKQKKGKKELLRLGKVDIPPDIYIKMLKG